MVDIVLSIAAKVSEYLVDPVVRQLGYLFHYHTNMEKLSQQADRLRDVKARHQHSVDEAIRNGHKIEDDVSKWLTEANEFIVDACKFLEDEKAARARKSCFNLKSWYQLSRESKKKAEVIAAQIHEGSRFDQRVSYHAPLQEIKSAPNSEALESRISTLNEVMEALRDANIKRIGVWGLGGVGKTTLVKQVGEQAAQEKLFDKVVSASVLQAPDFKRIQGELADKLGMKFEEETEQGRAARLHQRMKEEKTILVILDDLWADVELERIGIPSPEENHKGCKLLLTSRNREVLSNDMGTQKDFRVEHLHDEESWILFKQTAGDSIELEPDLKPVAIEVANQCAGLPIAIVTVATALKNKSLSIWKDALQQLKTQTASTNIKGMETKVYSSLKLSYDYLEGDEVKSFFLLCGLFYDYIRVRDLLKFGIGLRLFKGTNTLEEARNRIDTLADKLKASNLLLDSGNNASFIMHDLVRNVALDIASKQHHEFTLEEASVIRVEEWPKMDELRKITMRDVNASELPEGLVCPKLELFSCQYLDTNSVVKIPNTFFEGMKHLYVLDLYKMNLPLLPSSLQCLTNLRTLCLDECKFGGIAIIAELKNLEILSLADSDIERLPREIAQLTRLRLLDLDDCSKLKVIPPDVISSLSRLENLYMGNSFTEWGMEMDDQGIKSSNTNASLAELKLLSHLTCLEIQIPDAKLLPAKDFINVFDNLVRYTIFVGDIWEWEENFETNRTLKLEKFDTSLDHDVVDGMRKLMKRTEDLHLHELCGGINAVSKLDGEGFLKLNHLNVESSPEIQYIVDSMNLTSTPFFPVLETLFLLQLINLKQVCHGRQLPAGSFGRLKIVEVEDCDGLRFLFSLSVVRGLSRLEEISVSGCKSMEEMVIKEDEDEYYGDAVDHHVPLFPELKGLKLSNLPNLKHILCNCGSLSTITNDHVSSSTASAPAGNCVIFPKLHRITLESLPTLTSFSPPHHSHHSLQRLHNADLDTPSAVLFDGRVAFPCLEILLIGGLDNVKKLWDKQLPDNQDSFSKLKIVWVESCGELLNVFPSGILKRLQRLWHLTVKFCKSLEEVFDVEGIISDVSANNVNVKKETQLSELILESLPKVEKIWNEDPKGILTFRNLKVIKISDCQSLKNLFPASVAGDLVELQELDVSSCGIEEIVAKGVDETEAKYFVFPKLTSLNLYYLPQLRSFYSGPHTSQWPSLKQLSVLWCDKVNVFAFKSSPIFGRMHNGDDDNDDDGNLDDMPLFFSLQKVTFPCLEELQLYHNKGTEIWLEQFPMKCFTILKVLKIGRYGDHTSVVIPSFIFRRLHSLEELSVTECSSVKELFQLEGLEEENQAKLLVCLKKLHLEHLPGLTHLWKENSKPAGPPLQSLENLQVQNCGSLITLVPSSVSLRNLSTLDVRSCGSLRSLISPSVATLQSLENLLVWNCESLIYLVPSSSVSFRNVCTLDVRSCGSLRSLISPSVAKTLVALKRLTVGESLGMEEVVSDEGGEATDEIAFCVLENMELVDLPNLTSFSSGGYIFSFPSLERMLVIKCPKMKIFSPRPAVAPKLQSVGVGNSESQWHNDLNTTIQTLFTKPESVLTMLPDL